MDKQNPSVPPCAQPRIPRGITHINVRHTTRFTVIGNHLAQHPELSGLAIGLAVHIQSLPTGARADIKTLAARFPEGETRIAAALRELEAHGYLARIRERLPSGRVVTHTVSYNRPRYADVQEPRPTTPQSKPAPTPTPTPAPAPAPVQPDAEIPPSPAAAPHPSNPLPAPERHTHDSAAHHTATTLLASLHRDDARLLLAERDVRRLAPAVTAWLDRGAAPEAVRRTLTASLPEAPSATRPASWPTASPNCSHPHSPRPRHPGQPYTCGLPSRTATAATAPSGPRPPAAAATADPISWRPPSMSAHRRYRTVSPWPDTPDRGTPGGHRAHTVRPWTRADPPPRKDSRSPTHCPRRHRPRSSGGDAGREGRNLHQSSRVAVRDSGAELGPDSLLGPRDAARAPDTFFGVQPKPVCRCR
jgi:hypothetical protein